MSKFVMTTEYFCLLQSVWENDIMSSKGRRRLFRLSSMEGGDIYGWYFPDYRFGNSVDHYSRDKEISRLCLTHTDGFMQYKV